MSKRRNHDAAFKARVALGLAQGERLKDGGLDVRQDTIDAAQDGEGQNDLSVIGLLVITAKEVSDGPEEGGKGKLVQMR